MKTKIAVLATVIWLHGVCSVCADGISVWASYSPNDRVSEDFATYSGKVQAFLRGSQAPGVPSVNPTDFWLANRFDYKRAMVSVNTPLWNGVLNPAQHGDQRGGWLIFPIKIVSSTAFTPAEVEIEIRSNDPYEGHLLGSLGYIVTLTSWAPEAVGLWYGPDGVKGNGDDEIRVAGNGPANELYYTGPGTGYKGDTQSEIDIVSTYMNAVGPSFAVTATVSLEKDGSVILPAVKHRISAGGVPRIVLSNNRRTFLVAPESQGSYLVQSSADMVTWITPSQVRVTAGQVVGSVETTTSKFFRLKE